VRLEFERAGEVRELATPVATEPALPAPAPVNFFVGAGIGLWLPFGELAAGKPISDQAQAGVGLELRAGLRFARYFGAKLFVDGARLSAISPESEELGTSGPGAGGQVKVDTTVSAQSIGLSLLIGSPSRAFGGFGELGLVFQRLAISRDLTLDGNPSLGTGCDQKFSQTLALTGAALRVGGGATIPLSGLFELSPFAHGTFGRFSQSALDSECSEFNGPLGLGDDLASDRRATHAQVVIGIGGNFVFGQR
jgi:hypothetical protein